MRHRSLLLALPLVLGSVAFADEPSKPSPAPPAATPPAPAHSAKEEGKKDAASIPWIHDYEEAKKKAATEKKGLFVYMTPSWFT